MVDAKLANGDLVEVSADCRPDAVPTSVVYPSGRMLPTRVTLMVAALCGVHARHAEVTLLRRNAGTNFGLVKAHRCWGATSGPLLSTGSTSGLSHPMADAALSRATVLVANLSLSASNSILPDVGASHRWCSRPTKSASLPLAAAEPKIVLNGSSSVPRIRVNDPEPPFTFVRSGPLTFDLSGPPED